MKVLVDPQFLLRTAQGHEQKPGAACIDTLCKRRALGVAQISILVTGNPDIRIGLSECRTGAWGDFRTRTEKKYGNVWDHFTVVYEYASGAKVFSQCRQVSGCHSEVADYVIGTKGSAELMKHTITGEGGTWKADPKQNKDMYQSEHDELFAAIRAGKVINDGEVSAHSTLMGLMGREAAYTGKRVTWKDILNSKQNLQPKEYAWGPNAVPAVAQPGKTKFV